MAVGLSVPGPLREIDGISIGVGAAGIKKRDRNDVAVILCAPGTVAAGCFTRNRFQAAPVVLARTRLEAQASPRALIVNSGNANAGTGEQGMADARSVCGTLARLLDCADNEVLPFSTGVIGERLPVERISRVIPELLASAAPGSWLQAAEAIMTTDTLPKGASRRVTVADGAVTLTGIVKGSGMIRPDMATMLAFIATDAALPESDLKPMLTSAVDRSFNRITVDGDTSTNDACMLLATGRGAAPAGTDRERFQAALDDLCLELAQAVVRDAEGATKFIEIAVSGAESDRDAREVALTVAHSPLVKTALYASDANWGRILAAVGRAPAAFELDRVGLRINDCPILQQGELAPEYSDTRGAAAMEPPEIRIVITLGSGPGCGTVWTSDLSHDYIRINAEYRT